MSRTFKVWSPSEGETEQDADKITGDGARDAAELWADYKDASTVEYKIAGKGETPTVHVLHWDGPEKGKIEQFKAAGRSAPTYRARSLDEPDPEEA